MSNKVEVPSQFDCWFHATVMEWNPASARVFEKAGYQHEGLLHIVPTRLDSNDVDRVWRMADTEFPRRRC